MAKYRVPLILRGKIIEDTDVEFGGRRAGASFSSADVKKHLGQLPLSTPSALSDLYAIKFEEIVQYLEELGKQLDFKKNGYLQEAYELSVTTSGLSPEILKGIYETLGMGFSRAVTYQTAEKSIGIEHLEGWVPTKLDTGGRAWTRAIGA